MEKSANNILKPARVFSRLFELLRKDLSKATAPKIKEAIGLKKIVTSIQYSPV